MDKAYTTPRGTNQFHRETVTDYDELMLKSIWVAIFVLAAPAFAQSVEERLAKLEQEVRELRAENAELREQIKAPPKAPAAKTAQEIKPAGSESKMLIGGFIQTQAESGGRVDTRFGDENDRVFLRRARMNVQGSFAEKFDFKAELDLAGGLGSSSGIRAQATDVYTQWSKHPHAQIRAGQFKTPFGHEQLHSDTKTFTVERTLGTDRIGLGRQLGVQLGGDIGGVSYAIGAFNGNGTNVTFNDDEGLLTAGRVTGTLFKSDRAQWKIGANGYRSEDRAAPVAPELGFTSNTFSGNRRAWGIDTQFATGPIEIWGELLRARFDPATGATRDLNSFYLTGAWSLTPKLQAVAMYDTLDGDINDVRTWTVGANYFIKGHDLKLQLNLMRSDDDTMRVLARLQTMF
ncbi:MAG: porin [Acidobacteriota bacterium]|nr:porin [Acidobacteriota bacterium]